MNRLGTFAILALAAWPAAAQQALVLPVGPAGTERMQFQLSAAGAVRMADGILYQGEAKVVTPLGDLVLAQSELWFGYAPGTSEVETVRGKAFVPTPLNGQEVSIDEPVMAEVGFDLGENLKDLGVPLLDKRGYLFFKFDAGLTMRFGKETPEDLEEEADPSFELSFGPGAQSRIVVDPLDPMYYFAGGVARANKKKNLGEPEGGKAESEGEEGDSDIVLGCGSSRKGLFPFRPLVTWGIEDKAREFAGHRIQTGSFPLFDLPVSVRGHLITNLDPLATGELAVDPLGVGFGPVVRAGANGRFAFTLDFLKLTPLAGMLALDLSIPLGKATAAVEIVNDRQLAYLSGILDPAVEQPLGLLFAADEEVQAAALISSKPEESRLIMEGLYKVGPSQFAKIAGLDLGDVLRVQGRLRADRTGLFLHGVSETGVYLGPIASSGALNLDAEVPSQDPGHRYLQLGGRFAFLGLGIDGAGRVSGDGLAVQGKLTAPQFDMQVNGGIQAEPVGPVVAGSMSVPAALQPDLNGAIRTVARQVQADLDRRLGELQTATKNYEFELSLRGMRAAVPPVTDAVIREIDRQIPANVNARWPKVKTLFGTVEAPGKKDAIAAANRQAEPYRERLRNLKRQMQTGDSASARRALQSALEDVLAHQRLRITYKVPVANVTITAIDYQVVDSSLQRQINTALAGVRALPEASNAKVRAGQAWDLVPKRELLRQTADAIEKQASGAIPRIESIGFRFPYGRPEWEYQAVVTLRGKRSTVTVRLAPGSIASIGQAIGQAFAESL